MSKKSEKLAAELISLRLRYSDRDFDEATELLSSGRLFNAPLKAAKQARLQTESLKKQPKNTQGELSLGAQLAVEMIYQRIGSDAILRHFAQRMLDRDILKNSSSMRAFAEALDIRLPSKLPSRISLVERISSHLLGMDPNERSVAINQASALEQDVSSLQQWSDVIVRSNES